MKKISLREDAEKALKMYEKLEPYGIQEKLLQTLVKEYSDHTNRAAVDTKVKLLYLFYSTGIQAVSKMTDNIDFNAGRVITGEATIDELGRELFENMIQVCNGRMTKAESLGHREFGIFRIGYTF